MTDVNPADISRQTFLITKKGFDAQQVRAYLEDLASGVALMRQELEEVKDRNTVLESEVASTKAAEEALQMTLVTATRTKDEMLREAKEQAEELRHEAFQEAQRARSEAIRESDDLLTRSREEALQLLEDAKRNAQSVIAAARAEGRDLRDQVVHLRQALASSRAALEGTLTATLETVAETDDLLALANLTETIDDDAPVVVPDPEDLGVISDDVAESAHDDVEASADPEPGLEPETEPQLESEPDAEPELVDALVGETSSVELEFEAVPTADQLLAQLRS
ncbi:MAG: hypothetical protein HKO87_08890, partial [Acidimicrobiia bacterium]|nr:hypothetical protein [Acidimicrobiia bacterium]